MIKNDEIVKIGQILKPHGLKGELTLCLDYQIDIDNLSCIVIPINGIFVPFFIDSVRPKGNSSVLVSFDGISDIQNAEMFTGLEAYALNKDFVEISDEDEDLLFFNSLIGYKVADNDGKLIGDITDIDDSTENVLMTVTNAEQQKIFIPLAEDMIVSVDPDQKILTMILPDGLINLNM